MVHYHDLENFSREFVYLNLNILARFFVCGEKLVKSQQI